MKLKWEGRETIVHRQPVNELVEWIPLFYRTPFKLYNGGTNKYLDMIIRQPLGTDAEYIKDRQEIPVCTATHQYHLFQHRDVFKALVNALKLIVSDIQSHEATLKITEYGESMWVSFTLANYQLNKADQFPFLLEVSGLNTVGAGKALDVRLSWYEPTYETRIPFGMLSFEEVNFKKIKRKKEKALDSDTFTNDIHSFLRTHLKYIARERQLYNRWKAAKVDKHMLERWIDTDVQKKWDYELAARAYQIAAEGYDIQVKTLKSDGREQDSRKEIPPPSQLTQSLTQPRYYVRKDATLGKFVPARNAFDLSLILSWVISQKSTIPFQLKWVDLLYLMEKLVATDEGLRSRLF